MKNYFTSLMVVFFYSGFFISSGKPDQRKSAVLEKLHWTIERSDITKVQKEFQAICESSRYPSLVSGLKDGIYKGTTPDDDYGYRHEIVFEMKNGRMISVDYDEIHKDGHAKQHDQEYGKRMMKNGTSPAIAYPLYETQMLEKQDFNKVDAVTGASYSLFRFRLAILYAMWNSGQL